MRIVQLIDSLAAGGAERMAVNYANAIAKRGFSALVATRDEGPLRTELSTGVVYAFLNKKKAVDFKALSALRTFCSDNRIDVVHAHGTSYFLATLLKLRMPHLRIIWHDHFGLRNTQTIRQNLTLFLSARFLWGAIVVNQSLAQWSRSKLGISRVIYLPNFTILSDSVVPALLGGIEGKRIVCIANLRVPKNHHLIVRAAAEISKQFPEWTFHFVGKDYSDAYSNELKIMIAEMNLQNHVMIHGQRSDIKSVIDSCEIGLIASDYEGLPVALLEYGLCEKAVISTSVGQIPDIITSGKNGLLIDPNGSDQLVTALAQLIADPKLRKWLGSNLKHTIEVDHSETAVVESYFKWLENGVAFR